MTVKNDRVLAEGRSCQEKLHLWGRANQVSFDPSKESFQVLSLKEPEGEGWAQGGMGRRRNEGAVDCPEPVFKREMLVSQLRARRFVSCSRMVVASLARAGRRASRSLP